MNFIIMGEQFFDGFANNHPNHNVYQTKEYGRLMNRAGFNVTYVGMIDSDKTVLAAAMILSKKLDAKNAYAYIPGGILIDYQHTALLEQFLKSLKAYLKKQKAVFLRMDPMVPMYEYDFEGRRLHTIDNSFVLSKLQAFGFKHYGFNQYFESTKPRYVAIVDGDEQKVMNEQTLHRIKRAKEKGISIYKGNSEYIEDLYGLIKHKNKKRNLRYYENYYEIFNKSNMIDIYFAKIDVGEYSNNARALYEKELDLNESITNRLYEAEGDEKETLLNDKMESDKRLVVYKNDIDNSIVLFSNLPNGLMVCGLMVVKQGDTVHFIIDGTLDKFRNYYPKYLLYSTVINNYLKAGYKNINLNAIVGDFSNQNRYKALNIFKGSFATKFVEYPGEFIYILNPVTYAKLGDNSNYQGLLKKVIRK